MIAANPFLGPQWEGLGFAFTHLISSLRRTGQSFTVQVYGLKYNLSPYTSPFVQCARNEEGNLVVELSSNLQVNPPLTSEQFEALGFYGWESPECTPEEYREGFEGNPNFVRVFDGNIEAEKIAEFALTTLAGVLGIIEDDYFGFEPYWLAPQVAATGRLGRLKKSDGNPQQVIFALAGRHLEDIDAPPITLTCNLKGPARGEADQ